jgi:hypothetical protein
MGKPYIADEIVAAMAERLDIPGKVVADGAKVAAATSFAIDQIIRIADEMDKAGFRQVADMLDGALKGMVKTASAYDDFKEALKSVQQGDCQAVQRIYNRFAALMEGEGSFLRARQDCLAKCPSFKPMG